MSSLDEATRLARENPSVAGAKNVQYRLSKLYRDNPDTFELPPGYENNQGNIIPQRNILQKHPWLIAPMAIGAGFGGAALAGLGGAGAGGGAFPAIATGPGAAGIAGTTAVPTALGGASAAALPTAAAGGVLGSTTTAATSGILPTGSAGLGAGAGGGSVSTAGSILKNIKTGYDYANQAKDVVDTVRDVTGNVSKVAGTAEAARAANQDRNTQLEYDRERMRQAAPQTILRDVKRANTLANGPSRAVWGEPGSGPFGSRTLTYEGGQNAPLSAEARAQMQPFIDQQLQDLLHPRMDQPQFDPDRSTATDKILGGVALGGSLLGAGMDAVRGNGSRQATATPPSGGENAQGSHPALPYGAGVPTTDFSQGRDTPTSPLPGAGSPGDYGDVVDQYQPAAPAAPPRRYPEPDPDDPSLPITS